jgi:predicted ATPase with chaperone activity
MGNLSAAVPPTNSFEPSAPRSLEETGLHLLFLADLALKILYNTGSLTGLQMADRLKLPFNGCVDQVMEHLKRELMVEVRGGGGGFGEQGYQYTIAAKGREKAHEALDRSQYAGPAPVPLVRYIEAMHRQSLKSFRVTQQEMRRALNHMVLNDRVMSQIGPAVNSGRSIFLYGPPGDGKTTIAEAVGRMILTTDLLVPFAIEVDGTVIKIFDEANHQRSETQTGAIKNRDPRWVKIQRPVIVTGGELTLETLDLVWDDVRKYYEAPYQMKANGGMFLIDDFGRQQVRPRDLLNRWIVPLEKRVDYLTLHTGRKIEIPFDVLIVFSTNLAPRDLVDEAFLRRIRHKIDIGDPNFEEYSEIFKRVAAAKKMQYDDRALGYLIQEYYIKPRRRLRAVHPRDLIEQMVDIARYLNVPMVITKELIDQACAAYFVEL